MALMICPDCGNQVSDKATRCPVCGCPKSAIVAFKEEEQAKLEESIQKQRKDKRNRILKISVPIVACLVIVGIILFVRSRPDMSGLYHHVAWGTSVETVKQKVPDGSESENKDSDSETTYQKSEEKFLDIEGVSAHVVYLFKDDKLIRITCEAMPEDGSDLSDADIFKLVRNRLNELYGKYYYNDGTSTYMWKTDQSNIELWTFYNTMITFSNKSNSD